MRILQRVFQDYCGSLAVRLWNNETLCFNDGPQSATLVFDRVRPLREMILFRDPLRLAEAYFSGMVDVEGDIYEVLKLKDYLGSFSLSAREKTAFAVAALLLRDMAKAGEDARVGYRKPWYSAFLEPRRKGTQPGGHFLSLRCFQRILRPVARPPDDLFLRLFRTSGRRSRSGPVQQARPHLPQAAPSGRASAYSTSGAAGARWSDGRRCTTAYTPTASR